MPRSTKCFGIMGATTFVKNLGPPMPKRNDNSCLQENQQSQKTCTLPMNSQIDVVNKQLVPPLS